MRLGHQHFNLANLAGCWRAASELLRISKRHLFTFVQVINITAIVTTIILARRRNPICPYHLQTALAREFSSAS